MKRPGLLFAAATLALGALAAEPLTETVNVAGLAAPVEILVDRWGAPHVFAKNEDDVFVGQGFAAARDRLFQIDLWRRRGLGRLAEVLGPSFVEQDRAARLFLYRGDMQREWRAYSPTGGLEAQRIAESFVAGVNAYVAWVEAHPEKLPWEFQQLGYRPARWSAEDVVRIRSHGLTRNVTSEVERARTACAASLEADQVRIRLDPPFAPSLPEGLDPCLPKDVLKVFDLATSGVRLSGGGAEPVPGAAAPSPADVTDGSNNWTIAPSRSSTGRPILANDPHRAYSAPSLRYIAHLSAPGLDVIGAGEPALPGISIGHNGTIAFGLTIFAIDQADLYVYELNPENPLQYRYRAGWEAMRVLREQIAVKGAAPAAVELAFTRHGPVVFTDVAARRAFAVRSVWLEPGTAPYFGSIGYMRARDFEAFRAALRNWGSPSENQVYADAQGHIGWVAAGMTPIRPNWNGLLPVPGDGRYEWTGFLPGDELPQAYDPKQGLLATANEMNLPAGYPWRERRLGFEWSNPSRRARIGEVLGAVDKISLEDSMRLQNDRLSIPARRIVAVLRSIAPERIPALAGTDPARARTGRDLLAGWDAVLRPDSAPGALFEVWFARHLGRAVKAALLGEADAVVGRIDPGVVVDAVERPDGRLGPDPAGARDRLLLRTLAQAYAETEGLLGADATTWQWGRLHTSLVEHPLTAAVDAAQRAKIDVGPIPVGGSGYTVNAASYRASDFRQTSGPSFRIVVDVGNWNASRAVNYPGQSGDPASPHYRDLAGLWSGGEYFPLLYTREAIESAAESRITLLPVRPAAARP